MKLKKWLILALAVVLMFGGGRITAHAAGLDLAWYAAQQDPEATVAALYQLFNANEYAELYPDVKAIFVITAHYADKEEFEKDVFNQYLYSGLYEARRPNKSVTQEEAFALKELVSVTLNQPQSRYKRSQGTISNRPSTINITLESVRGKSQKYNGDPEGRGPGRIIVQGYDYNDLYHDGTNVAWPGAYWTASNGVEIKVHIAGDGSTVSGMRLVPVVDGKGNDLLPESPYRAAIAEAEGDDINNHTALNITVPLATQKRTQIDINDADLIAYRDAYDYKRWDMNAVAAYYTPYKWGDPINLRYFIAGNMFADVGMLGPTWTIFKREDLDYWWVSFDTVPDALSWEGFHQALRYLSPDGEELYQQIYEDFYFGFPISMMDQWWPMEGTSQIYVKNRIEEGKGVDWYFK